MELERHEHRANGLPGRATGLRPGGGRRATCARSPTTVATSRQLAATTPAQRRAQSPAPAAEQVRVIVEAAETQRGRDRDKRRRRVRAHQRASARPRGARVALAGRRRCAHGSDRPTAAPRTREQAQPTEADRSTSPQAPRTRRRVMTPRGSTTDRVRARRAGRRRSAAHASEPRRDAATQAGSLDRGADAARAGAPRRCATRQPAPRSSTAAGVRSPRTRASARRRRRRLARGGRRRGRGAQRRAPRPAEDGRAVRRGGVARNEGARGTRIGLGRRDALADVASRERHGLDEHESAARRAP